MREALAQAENITAQSRALLTRAVAVLTVLSLGVGLALAGGAGRSRPGGSGSGSGSGSGRPQHAVGRATYGYGGHSGHGHHGGHHGYYGHAYYGYSHYGSPYYYPYFAYAAWPWGWYGGWPYRSVPYKIDPNAPGAVETDVSPKKAVIHVDGEYVGQARDYNGRFNLLWLDSGEHVIEFSKDGYKTLRRYIDVQAGMHARVAERMEKGEGLDPRSTERPEAPALDTRAAPPPPASPSPAQAPQGSLRRGLLRLEIGPSDAAVYLDGEFLARASELSRLHGAIPVARGPHRIEVVRPGFESRTVEVDVEGEMPVRVEIDLQRGEP